MAINDVACEIALNDVPLVRHYHDGRLDVTVPMGEFVVGGSNHLTITSLVDRSRTGWSTTRATATLLAAPSGTTDWQPIGRVGTRAVPGGEGEATTEVEDGPLGAVGPQQSDFDPDIMLLKNRRNIQLNASVPRWAWQSSSAVPADADDQAIITSLIEWYRWFYALLRDRDLAAVRSATAEKIAELATAHETSPEIILDEMGLARALADDNLRLLEPAWDELRLERAANGRLVRLYHSRDGAVIVFQDEVELRHTFDLWLRGGGDSWVISR